MIKMSAIFFVIVGIFFFADGKPQQSVSEKPVIEKQNNTSDNSKQPDKKPDDKKAVKKKREVKEPELRKELLERNKTDQEWRGKIVEFEKKHTAHTPEAIEKLSAKDKAEFNKIFEDGTKVDKENTEWFKGIIAKHGWPTFSLVGKDGAGAAWLLVQHADLDPKFQRECLDLMEKLPKTEISKSNFAYLTDRVLLAEGKKQIYGTQCTFNDKGEFEPRPLEDEKNVDKRRAEMGLGTIEKYLQSMKKSYIGETKK
jgi:hypothetical protein